MSVTCDYFDSIEFPDRTNVWRLNAEGMRLEPLAHVPVTLSYENYADVVSAVMLGNAIRHADLVPDLVMKYFPAARQDRRTQKGESHGVEVITRILQVGGFKCITVYDPHSEVIEACNAMTPASLKIITQGELLSNFASQYTHETVCLVAPDAGAFKKVSQCASTLHSKNNISTTMLVGNKSRDPATGKLTVHPIINVSKSASACKTFIVVDDICDGGGTFIPMAHNLRDLFGSDVEIILYVTHGLFSAGLENLKAAGFNKIWCHNVMNQSREMRDALASGFLVSV